ncbi:MAG: acetolactate synthase [Verrucomicrobiales bacterium]|nr:acetolactate synthase [Verrucomicrobiales bacterium]
MKPVQLLAVFAENKPDQLARVTRQLADAGVNIHWVGIADVQKFGVIRFLVDKTDLAFEWLKQHDVTVSRVEVLAVEVEDRPGGLHQVAAILAGDSISLANVSGFVFNHRAILLLEVPELERARRLLTDRGLHLLSEEEMLSL